MMLMFMVFGLESLECYVVIGEGNSTGKLTAMSAREP